MAAAPKIVEPLRVGVIGLGFFGRRHAGIYAAHPAAELVGVCDIDEQAREEIVGRTGAAAHATHEELLARDDLDAVSVCLPDRHHEAAAIAVAQAGKAMLLEKPLAHTTDAARRIVEAVEAAGTRLMVGHILRFDPRYAQLHAAADPERIGTAIHLRAERMGIRSTAERLGPASSILFYTGVHDIDAMQWVARSRIAEVYARKREVLGSGNEDSLFALLTFENGALGSLNLSWAWPEGLMNGYRAALEIVGTRSATYLDCADQGFYVVGPETVTGGDTHLWPEIDGHIRGDLSFELDHFVQATRSDESYRQSYREAFDAIPVLDALASSVKRGMAVPVERNAPRR